MFFYFLFWKYENWLSWVPTESMNKRRKLSTMIQNAIDFDYILANSSYKMPHFSALHSITCHIRNAVHVNENKNKQKNHKNVKKTAKKFRKSLQFYGFYEDLNSIQNPCPFRVLGLYFCSSKGVAGLAYLCCHGKGSSCYWSFFWRYCRSNTWTWSNVLDVRYHHKGDKCKC